MIMEEAKVLTAMELMEQAVVEYITNTVGINVPVPATEIKKELGLDWPCAPMHNEHDFKGYVFAAVIRQLEEKAIIYYNLDDNIRGQCTLLKNWEL